MTDRELMQQALDALNHVNVQDRVQIITALRDRLAQPEQEPVAWLFQHEETGLTECVDTQQVEWGFEKNNPRWQKIAPLYTTPPQRKPLTHPQIHEFDWPDGVSFDDILSFVRAIEEAHGIKEKNT